MCCRCVAVSIVYTLCCSLMQSVVVCCGLLHHTLPVALSVCMLQVCRRYVAGVLQCSLPTHCSLLQSVAVCGSRMKSVADCCSPLYHTSQVALSFCMLQVCCSAHCLHTLLQSVAVYCSLLQSVTSHVAGGAFSQHLSSPTCVQVRFLCWEMVLLHKDMRKLCGNYAYVCGSQKAPYTHTHTHTHTRTHTYTRTRTHTTTHTHTHTRT